MRWLRYPRTPLELLVTGTGWLAATCILIAIIFALYVLANAFAVAGFLLAVMLVWEFAVERPMRRARAAETLAAQSRPLDDIPLWTRVGRADWSERLPGPLGAIVRTAPATLVAILIIGAALGINSFLGDLTNPTRDNSVYVPLQAGASGNMVEEGNSTRTLRVTLLTVRQWAVRPDNGNMYWAAEVEVRNTGTQAISSPAWTLRTRGEEYDPVTADAPGEALGGGFTLPRGGVRTGWVVFEVPLGFPPEWLRARLPDYADTYFAIRSTYEEKVSR